MLFENLFFIIRDTLMKLDVSQMEEHVAFEFQVQGNPEGVFYVEIENGRMRVEPYEYYDRDALFVASGNTYLEICQGFLNPMLAFAVGRLRVFGNMDKVKMLSKLF